VWRGLAGRWDGVDMEVLSPARVPRAPWRVRNDDSVVLRLRYGESSFLLAGDIERGAEDALAQPLAAVLKVPHHGSRSSSSPGFVAAVSPRVALLSAGHRNRHGHPHPEVVDRYQRQGIELLRTDVHGTITVCSDGRRLWVRTFAQPWERRIR
jgi:competence protein ComEC